MRFLSNNKPKKPLIVQSEEGMVAGSEKEQISIITKHFAQTFSSESNEEAPIILPSKMSTPFNETEIQKATKSMKNQRSVGTDGLNAEYIKYAPPASHAE